ncbi:hypothetical protein RFI_31462, partial [Reticulomyxa filosa]
MSSKKTADRSLWLVLDGFPTNADFNDVGKSVRQVVDDVCQRVGQNVQSPVFWIPLDNDEKKQQQHYHKIRGFALIQAPNREYAIGKIMAFLGFPFCVKKNEIKIKINEPKKKKKKKKKKKTSLSGHNMSCWMWNEVQEKMKISDTFEKIGKNEFLEERNLYWWLLDKDSKEGYRDQYVVRFRGQQFEETIVYWHDERIGKTGRVESYDGKREHTNRE